MARETEARELGYQKARQEAEEQLPALREAAVQDALARERIQNKLAEEQIRSDYNEAMAQAAADFDQKLKLQEEQGREQARLEIEDLEKRFGEERQAMARDTETRLKTRVTEARGEIESEMARNREEREFEKYQAGLTQGREEAEFNKAEERRKKKERLTTQAVPEASITVDPAEDPSMVSADANNTQYEEPQPEPPQPETPQPQATVWSSTPADVPINILEPRSKRKDEPVVNVNVLEPRTKRKADPVVNVLEPRRKKVDTGQPDIPVTDFEMGVNTLVPRKKRPREQAPPEPKTQQEGAGQIFKPEKFVPDNFVFGKNKQQGDEIMYDGPFAEMYKDVKTMQDKKQITRNVAAGMHADIQILETLNNRVDTGRMSQGEYEQRYDDVMKRFAQREECVKESKLPSYDLPQDSGGLFFNAIRNAEQRAQSSNVAMDAGPYQAPVGVYGRRDTIRRSGDGGLEMVLGGNTSSSVGPSYDDNVQYGVGGDSQDSIRTDDSLNDFIVD